MLTKFIRRSFATPSSRYHRRAALRRVNVPNHFYELQFYAVLWLILPMTDGAAVVNELLVTKKVHHR